MSINFTFTVFYLYRLSNNARRHTMMGIVKNSGTLTTISSSSGKIRIICILYSIGLQVAGGDLGFDFRRTQNVFIRSELQMQGTLACALISQNWKKTFALKTNSGPLYFSPFFFLQKRVSRFSWNWSWWFMVIMGRNCCFPVLEKIE